GTALGSVFRTDFVALPHGGDEATEMTGRASVYIGSNEAAVVYLEPGIPVAPAPAGLECVLAPNMPGWGNAANASRRYVGIALALPRGYQLLSDTVTFTMEFSVYDANDQPLDLFDLLRAPRFQVDFVPYDGRQGTNIPAWEHLLAQPTSRPQVAVNPLPGTNTIEVTMSGLDLTVDLPPVSRNGAALNPDWQFFAATYLNLTFRPMLELDLPVRFAAEIRNCTGTTLGGQTVVDGTDIQNPDFTGGTDDNSTVGAPFNPPGTGWSFTWRRTSDWGDGAGLRDLLGGVPNALEDTGNSNSGLGWVAPGQHVLARGASNFVVGTVTADTRVGTCLAVDPNTALPRAVEALDTISGQNLDPANLTLWYTTDQVLNTSTAQVTAASLDCSMDGPSTWRQLPVDWTLAGSSRRTVTDFPADTTAWKVLYAPPVGQSYVAAHQVFAVYEVMDLPADAQVWFVAARRMGADTWEAIPGSQVGTPQPGSLFTGTTMSADRFTIIAWSPRVTIDTSHISPSFGTEVTLPVVHGPRGIRNAGSTPVDYVVEVTLPAGVTFTGVADGTPAPRSVVIDPVTGITTLEWDARNYINEDQTFEVLVDAAWLSGPRRADTRVTSDNPVLAERFATIPATRDYTTMVRTPEGETRLTVATTSPLPLDEYHRWTVTLTNLDTRDRDLTDTIVVLPWNGDGRSTAHHGTLSLGEVLPGPNQEVWFTTAPAASLDADPRAAANGGLGNPGASSIWVNVRPADSTAVTGIRLVSTVPLEPGETFVTVIYTANLGGRAGDWMALSAEARESMMPGTQMYAGTARRYLGAPDIAVTKTSPLGDPALLVVPGADVTEIPVLFTVENTGNDALINLTWADVTLAGPDVIWTHCEPGLPAGGNGDDNGYDPGNGNGSGNGDDGSSPNGLGYGNGNGDGAGNGNGDENGAAENPLAGLTVNQVFAALRLDPGDGLTCHGTLDMTGAEFHHNDLTITGLGYASLTQVRDSDDWQITVVTGVCEKEYTERVLQPGETTTHTWTIRNDNELDMPVSAATDLAAALAHTELVDGSLVATKVGPTGEYDLTADALLDGTLLTWEGVIAAGSAIVVSYDLLAGGPVDYQVEISVVTDTCVGPCEVPLVLLAPEQEDPEQEVPENLDPAIPTPEPTPTPDPTPSPTPTPDPTPSPSPEAAPSVPARPTLPVTGASAMLTVLVAVTLFGLGGLFLNLRKQTATARHQRGD
ncbi:MAG: hypothetical protein FWG11_05805, partial [Promicromonosporaceae bacterium]|nr:hypothetical protein [Promicromonosporaceae bacterium]